MNAPKRAYGSGLRFINVLEVITKNQLVAADIPGRVTIPRDAFPRYNVKEGDLLFNRTSETQEDVALASVYLDKEPVLFGGFVIRGRPKASIDPRFLAYALRATFPRKQIIARAQGAIRSNIGQVALGSVVVNVPRTDEQKAIAQVLDDTQAQSETLGDLILKKQAMKLGVMQKLLTGLARLPGYRAKWQEIKLGELGKFSRGRGIKRNDVSDEGLPCIRYGELYTRYDNYTSQLVSRIPPSVVAGSFPISKGDLLFAASGETRAEIGKCVAYVGNEAAFAGGDIIVFSPTWGDPIFLGHLLNHDPAVNQKARLGQGDAVVHISAKNLGRLSFRVPEVEEQNSIARLLVEIDTEIYTLEQCLEKTQMVERGMRQALLSGRTRLRS